MLKQYLNKYVDIAPLVVFRILFGVLMFFSILRFWYHGWIEKLYINPSFHFHYQGFEWVNVPGKWTYLLFAIAAISAISVAIGFKYRIAIIMFFCSFTYIELMDKTTYLNHYYFISIVSFLLIFLPAGKSFALDLINSTDKAIKFIPRYTIDALRVVVAIVYIYAGLFKLNSDWMLEAMPLAMWLPSKVDIPLLGSLMHFKWVHYAFSWTGMLYDTLIVFFLLNRRTRSAAFFVVVLFHLLTRILFPIGMFPYIMICAALIFFSDRFHLQLLQLFSRVLPKLRNQFRSSLKLASSNNWAAAQKGVIIVFLLIQLVFPWRYLLNEGNVFWNEQGYRFSWRVMLMEKAGYAQFTIKDSISNETFLVDNSDFLTNFQEKQMSTQVDFIIEYAHHLKDHFTRDGHQGVEVYVDSYVALNGRPSQEYVHKGINLLNYDLHSHYNNLLVNLKDD